MVNEVKESPKDFLDTFEVGFLFGMMFVILTQFVMVYVWFDSL